MDEIICELIRPIGELRFDNCRIPARYRVGEEGKGWEIFNGRYAYWLSSSGAQVGSAQAIYDFARDFAKTRVQGGKPIIEHLTIGTRLVEMLTNIEQVRLLTYKTAWDYDRTGSVLLDPLRFCLCNAAAKDLGLLAAGHVAEIFASRAVLKDLPVEAYIRGVYANNHGLDTPTFNRIRAMKML
jgi:alkylation response protein AidB-like acyl-CoA dehydrogenase